MRNLRSALATGFGLSIALGAGLLTAGCENRQVAIVTLEGRPADAAPVVYYRLNDGAAKVGEPMQSPDRFGIELPLDTSGILAVDVFTYRSGVPCILSQGSGTVEMPGKYRQNLTVTMNPSSTGACQAAGEPVGFPTQKMAVWAAAPEDIWIVGEQGKILRWNGRIYTSVPLPSTVQQRLGRLPDLNGVWGTAADDVYIFGDDNTILHTEKGALVEVPQTGGALLTNWRAAHAGRVGFDMWFAGSNGILGYLLLSSGAVQLIRPTCTTGFQTSDSHTFNAVWCTPQPSYDCWFAGDQGLLLRSYLGNYALCYDFRLASMENLNGVWVGLENATTEEVRVVGTKGTVLRARGVADAFGVIIPNFMDSSVSQSQFIPTDMRTDFWAIYGTDLSELWFVGRNGTLVKWNQTPYGSTTNPFEFKPSGLTGDLTSVWSNPSIGLLTAGPGNRLTYSGPFYTPGS